MPVSSPLAALHIVLQTVCASAEANAGLLRKNEAATRAALIDPVLRALGWDTANVRMVEPEKTITTAWRADYALHDSRGKIALLVEAKCLGSDLEKFSVVQQLLSYAFGFGVEKILLTDGLSWHFYSEFKPGNPHSGASFNLLQDELGVCALHLIQWLDAAHSGHGIGPVVVNEAKAALSLRIPATPKSPAPKVRERNTAEISGFVALTHIGTLQLAPNQKPKQLRLPDGTVKPLKSWKDILVEACRFVLEHNPKIPLPLPDKAGKKTVLLSWQKPPQGITSYSLTHQGKPLFVYTNYSASACLTNALHVLKLIPSALRVVDPGVAF